MTPNRALGIAAASSTSAFLFFILFLLLAFGVLGCESDAAPPPPPLTDGELAMVRTLSPLPPLGPDTTNRYAADPAAATFGQRLFFDAGYSGPIAVASTLGQVGEAGRISCASCHLGPGLVDTRSQPGTVSVGAGYLGRNSLGLINASYYKWVNWAGRFSAQWQLPLAVAENASNMNSDRLRVAHRIFDKYAADYQAVFGPLDPALGTDATRFPASAKPKANAMAADGAWEAMTDADRTAVNAIYVNYGKAIAAYLRKLVSPTSPFDDFVAGRTAALTAEEVAGLKVFLGKGRCASCHKGPNFTDDDFHNLGVPQTGEHVPMLDNGRFADIPPLLASPFNDKGPFSDDRNTGRLDGLTATPPESTRGQFRTPTLRNVADSPPYMHAGQLATLEAVIDFYDRGGGEPSVGTKDALMVPLGLSATEKANLAAFLRALRTGALPAALLQDTSAK